MARPDYFGSRGRASECCWLPSPASRVCVRGIWDYSDAPTAQIGGAAVTGTPPPAQDERPLIDPDDAPSHQGDIISFGPFRLFPAARAFEKNGVPLVLGNRALDILMVLVERAGEVVSHRELIARVWRGLVVDPSNLRVHMTGLRRALGDRDRYIANVTGQGYCFVAPVRRETTADSPTRVPEYPCGAARQRLVLPPVLARMVGREEAMRTIAADLIAARFVTVIGPGGLGETTDAVAVAHPM